MIFQRTLRPKLQAPRWRRKANPSFEQSNYINDWLVISHTEAQQQINCYADFYYKESNHKYWHSFISRLDKNKYNDTGRFLSLSDVRSCKQSNYKIDQLVILLIVRYEQINC